MWLLPTENLCMTILFFSKNPPIQVNFNGNAQRVVNFPPSVLKVSNLVIVVELYWNESEMNLKIENKPQIYRLTSRQIVHADDEITARDSDRIDKMCHCRAMIIERDYDEIDNLAEMRKHWKHFCGTPIDIHCKFIRHWWYHGSCEISLEHTFLPLHRVSARMLMDPQTLTVPIWFTETIARSNSDDVKYCHKILIRIISFSSSLMREQIINCRLRRGIFMLVLPDGITKRTHVHWIIIQRANICCPSKIFRS